MSFSDDTDSYDLWKNIFFRWLPNGTHLIENGVCINGTFCNDLMRLKAIREKYIFWRVYCISLWMCDCSTPFNMWERNRNVKTIDWYRNLSIILRYKLERIMIKEHGNVRKRTKKNIGRQPHIKVYRDGVKTSKRYTFFNVEFCAFSNFFAVSFS